MSQRLHDSTAAEMGSRQRNIAISEFFLKNRHLLGFDSLNKAIVTTVKEAVDNALDACEDAGIPPEVEVEIEALDDAVFRVVVQDNGPGIVAEQLARIFGKLLYGSKFHELRQSRGQQGMGISAAGMYGQLTTGRPMIIKSRVKGDKSALEVVVSIDTARNKPDVHKKRRLRWKPEHGTRVEVVLEGHYSRGQHSVDMYLKQTAVANPHVTLRLRDPQGSEHLWERSTRTLPPRPSAIKPHPHGIELGRLIQMLHETRCRTLQHFLREEFSRVGPKTADDVIRAARGRITPRSNPTRVAHAGAKALYSALQKTRITPPRSDCIAPIGERQLLEGLKKELDADSYLVLTRPPAVYRGNPFVVEVGLAYGRPGRRVEMDDAGRLSRTGQTSEANGELPARKDDTVLLLRYANRVPLLYQQSACAITKAVIHVNWKAYGLSQPRGGLPLGRMAILVHVASVWVPFTSESKEAIAAYPEIERELHLALQELGRRLAKIVQRGRRLEKELERRGQIEVYLPHVGSALQEILGLDDEDRDRTVHHLDETLHRKRSHR